MTEDRVDMLERHIEGLAGVIAVQGKVQDLVMTRIDQLHKEARMNRLVALGSASFVCVIAIVDIFL